MKNAILILTVFFIFILSLPAQDAKEVLTKAREKCASITSGFYEYTQYMKLPSSRDTFQAEYQCYFHNLPGDSILPFAFHCKYINNNESVEKIMYTGTELIEFFPLSNIAGVFDKTSWAQEIHARQHEFKFYAPFSGNDFSPLPSGVDLLSPENEYDWIGEEIISGVPCLHILFTKYLVNDDKETLRTQHIDYNFWIREDNFLPVQYSTSYLGLMNDDTVTQYDKYSLTAYQFDKPVDEKQFTKRSIGLNYTFKDYTSNKKKELLKNNTPAPVWSLSPLKGRALNLTDLKGSLVLLHFFYKDCPGCGPSFTEVENLHVKYKKKGLHVIGIDTYGKTELFLKNFIAEHKITYPVLPGSNELSDQYHISNYPTFYIIDKEGKIVYSSEGLKKGTEVEIEKIIKENL